MDPSKWMNPVSGKTNHDPERVPLAFRMATATDISEVLPMMAAFNAIDGYPFDKARVEENILWFISDPALGRLWLMTVNETLAGYVALTFGFSFEYNGRDAFLDELFIKEEFRGKGLGGQVMDFLEIQAGDLGVRAIHLEVEPHNEMGNRLYHKKGYAANGRVLLSKRLKR